MGRASKQSNTTRRKRYSAPALEKGLDILELLADAPDGLNLGEIVTRLDRTIGELFRMLVVLEQRGYVTTQPDSDKYILTLRLFNLAHRFPPVKRLISVATPIMKRLAYAIEQSCHLVIYYEGKGHVIAQQDPPSDRMLVVRLGAEVPLASTCSGHLLLAFSDDTERERMLSHVPKGHEKLSDKRLAGIIKRVTRQGFESMKSNQAQGVRDIGYPVFDHSDQLAAALVIPFLSYLDDSHPVSVEDAQEQLSAAAQKISNGLGYQLH